MASPLPDELVDEILLRLPPADPGSLVRAALVCRGWRRILTGPAFRRRFLARVPAPPPGIAAGPPGGPWVRGVLGRAGCGKQSGPGLGSAMG